MLAECQLRFAAENDGPLVRPVLEREVLQRRRSRRGAHLAGELPRVVHHPLAARQRHSDRPRQRQRAIELRDAAVETQRTVDLGGQRTIRGVDAEPELEPAVLVEAIARYPIAVKLVADDKGAVAPERPGERADVAVERELLQHDARAGAGVGERDASVLDLKTRDGERVRTESRRWSGPVDRACAVDAETDLRRKEAQLRGLHLATQQRTKPDFDLDRAGPQLRLPARLADLDVAELDPRRRQNAGFYGAVDANSEAGELAGLLLERRTVVIPIDDKRRDQRRHERQNDSDGQSEQCRLHREASP